MNIALILLFSFSTAVCLAQNGVTPSFVPAIPPALNPTVVANGLTNSALVPVPRAGKEVAWNARVAGKIAASEKMNEKTPIEVIFDGDSITDYWEGRAHDLWTTYKTRYNAFNFGISGDGTQNLLCRLNKGQAAGLKPKLIFLMIGHNNLMNNTAAQIHEAVAAIIKKYQDVCPDSMIILQATFPTKEPGSKWRKAVEALDKSLPDLAQDGKVTYVDFGDKFLSPDGTISKDIMPDGTHPVEKGYQIWAAAIQPILDQYFPPSATK